MLEFNPLKHIFYAESDRKTTENANPNATQNDSGTTLQTAYVDREGNEYAAIPTDGTTSTSSLLNSYQSVLSSGAYEGTEGTETIEKSSTTGEFICYPIFSKSDSNNLYENGCYCFKLSFAPDFKMHEMFNYGKREQSVHDLTVDLDKWISGLMKKFTDWDTKEKNKAGAGKEEAKGFFENAENEGFLSAVGSSLWSLYDSLLGSEVASKMDYLKTALNREKNKIIAGAMFNNVEFAQMIDSNKDDKELKFKDNFISVYKYQNLNTAHVFLPLNSMNIKRESGISSVDNVIGSVNQSMVLKQFNEMENKIGTSKQLQGKGITDNKYKGITVSGVPFETYSMEWDLMPRNYNEMENILLIITYFQCACLSAVNLNDTNNMKMVLPPKAEMGIITSVKGKNEGRSREQFDRAKFGSYNVNYRSVTFNTLPKDDYKNSRVYDDYGTPAANVRWLKRPIPVYIKSVDIEPMSNGTGVLLSSDGFPMGVKLKVTLCRTEMTSLKDVLIDTDDYDFEKANPFN